MKDRGNEINRDETSKTINNNLVFLFDRKEDNNKSSEFYFNRAFNKMSEGRYNEALPDLEKALKDDKQNAVILLNIGLIHNIKGDFTKALETFDQAKEIVKNKILMASKEENKDTFWNEKHLLGMLYANTALSYLWDGRLHHAKKNFLFAIKNGVESGKLYSLLADIYVSLATEKEALGDEKAAKRMKKSAVKCYWYSTEFDGDDFESFIGCAEMLLDLKDLKLARQMASYAKMSAQNEDQKQAAQEIINRVNDEKIKTKWFD